MTKLFSDSEVFTRTRPTDITDAQREQMYRDIAQDIINEGFAECDIDDIVEDIKAIRLYRSGYEIAKRLERRSCLYDFSADFISFLDDLQLWKYSILSKNVQDWVKAVNPQPKYKEGDKLQITTACYSNFHLGDIRYIMRVDEIEARYAISTEYPATEAILIEYEVLEARSCKIITKK